MTGQELYQATYDEGRRMGYPMPEWRALDTEAKADWELKALEQYERDMEVSR